MEIESPSIAFKLLFHYSSWKLLFDTTSDFFFSFFAQKAVESNGTSKILSGNKFRTQIGKSKRNLKFTSKR